MAVGLLAATTSNNRSQSTRIPMSRIAQHTRENTKVVSASRRRSRLSKKDTIDSFSSNGNGHLLLANHVDRVNANILAPYIENEIQKVINQSRPRIPTSEMKRSVSTLVVNLFF